MKRYIQCMTRNTKEGFGKCTPAWVAYEVHTADPEAETSSNQPGRIIVRYETRKHPNHGVTFQLTPLTIDKLRLEVVEDNYIVESDPPTIRDIILRY